MMRFSTYLNTYNHVSVSVDPPELFSDVKLSLNTDNKQGTFDLGKFDITLGGSPSDIKVYGYNWYNPGGPGLPDTTPIQWQEIPDGPLNKLADFEAYRLSLVLRKPFNEDADPITKAARNQVFRYLKQKVQENYNFLITAYPVGSPEYDAGMNGKSYFETPDRWNEFHHYSNVWSDTLLSFFTFGNFPVNTTPIDSEQLWWTSPARGISPSDLGSPHSIDFSPIIRFKSPDDWANFLKHPSVKNINSYLDQIGVEVKYEYKNEFSMHLSTYAEDPLLLSESRFKFMTPNVALKTGFTIKNFPVFPSEQFSIELKTIFQTSGASSRFDQPAQMISFEFSRPIP